MRSDATFRSVVAIVGALVVSACHEDEPASPSSVTDGSAVDHDAGSDLDRDAIDAGSNDVAPAVDASSDRSSSVPDAERADAIVDAILRDGSDASIEAAASADSAREGAADANADLSADGATEIPDAPDGARVDAGPPPVRMPTAVRRLAYDVVDVEYSRFLDRMVIASTTPRPALHVVDPGTGQDDELALPSAPTSVSVSPNGRLAATGHDGDVALIDLVHLAPVNRCYVGPGIVDVALTDEAQAYVSIPFVQLRGSDLTRCLDLKFVEFSRPSIARLQIDEAAHVLYWVDEQESWPTVHRDDISAGAPAPMPNVSDMSRFDNCPNCWMGEDGRLYLDCDWLFDSVKLQPTPLFFHWQHLNARGGRIVLLPKTFGPRGELVPGASAREYDSAFQVLADFTLRELDADAGTLYGRFVFFRNDVSAIFAVVQQGADQGAQFAIETFQP